MDRATLGLQSYVTELSMFQQGLREFGLKTNPPSPQSPILYQPGEKVLIRTWKDRSPKSQLDPIWKWPLPVLLSSTTAIKVLGISSWIHHSRVKPWKPPPEDSGTPTSYTCEPLEDLKLLFKRTKDK